MGGGGAKESKSTAYTRGKMVFAFFLAYAFCFNNTCCCYTKYRLLWLLDDDLSHHFLHQSDKVVSDILQRDENLVASL